MPTTWYDDWKLNPPEPKVRYKCEVCGEEIFEGDCYYKIDNSILCTDSDCFHTKAREIIHPEEHYA